MIKRRPHMSYVHAADVADAVVGWTVSSDPGGVFNIVSSSSYSMAEWIRGWCSHNELRHFRIFVPAWVVRPSFAILERLLTKLGKEPQGDWRYGLKCATRDIVYSSSHLQSTMQWKDKETRSFFPGTLDTKGSQ